MGKKRGYFFLKNNIVFSLVNMRGNILVFKQAPWGTFFFPRMFTEHTWEFTPTVPHRLASMSFLSDVENSADNIPPGRRGVDLNDIANTVFIYFVRYFSQVQLNKKFPYHQSVLI